MSKTIAEVYEEVIRSAELQKEFLEAERNGTIEAFAATHDCETTAEEVQAFLKEKLNKDQELSIDELEQVAGGKDSNSKPNFNPACPNCGNTETQATGVFNTETGQYSYTCLGCGNVFWKAPAFSGNGDI